jgi:cytoskeletal protein CcmA (bactofilin family)
MIFRRRQDETEGFRRMREALRQQADPQDHALLDSDEGYATYDEEAALGEEEEELAADALTEATDEASYDAYTEPALTEPASSGDGTASQIVSADTLARAFPGGTSMTTIGADTSWNGTLRSESNVFLEGRVEGTVEVRDTIFISERATIDARLRAHSVVVSGQLTGHIDCDGRLEVTPTGRINAEVEAGSLVVHEGAILDGKFKMKSGVTSPSH